VKIIWLLLAVFTLGLALYNLIVNGFESSYMFFVMSFLSFILFFVRKKLSHNKSTSPDE